MSGPLRAAIFATGAVAVAVAICSVLLPFGSTCAMAVDPSRAAGACLAAQAGTREMTVLGIVGVMILGAVLLASIGIQAARHQRIAMGLWRLARPAVVAGHDVGLVPGVGAALVAGIRRPRIYCAEDLAVDLSPDEVRAVLLHERHHELSHAPAKLVVLSALAPFLGRLEVGSSWLERWRASIEIAADEHAIHNGATRTTLARAILKLRDAPSQLSLAGFAAASDLRLRALLGEDVESGMPSGRTIAAAVVITAVVGILCSALPLL